jgi:hypothetical protein
MKEQARKLFPIQDRLPSGKGGPDFRCSEGLRLFSPQFNGQAAEFPKMGNSTQPTESSRSCGCTRYLTRRCKFTNIKEFRNKAAKPFRINIASEKQSWILGMWRVRNWREPFGGALRSSGLCGYTVRQVPGDASSPTLKNSGTKLPSHLESALLMKNKAGYRRVRNWREPFGGALRSSSSPTDIRPGVALRRRGGISRKSKNVGTKLGGCFRLRIAVPTRTTTHLSRTEFPPMYSSNIVTVMYDRLHASKGRGRRMMREGGCPEEEF